MRGRKNEAVDAEKLAKIARDYYVYNRRQADIAAEYGKNQSTIAHWLADALARGIVAIDIDPDFALAGFEHPDLSRRMRDAFDLYECLVVDPGDATLYEDQKSDKLHTVVANTSGMKLKEWIRSGDHIAIGGGRAPMRVARFIRRTPPPRREIRITPLSGRIWIGSWQEDGPDNLQRPLDADDAARLLAVAYEHEPGTRFSQIGHPLYAASARAAARIIKEECMFQPGGTWRTDRGIQPPIRALVGLGALHPASGHRISELLNDASGTRDVAHLAWAAERYKEAVKFTRANRLQYFGDVANRLFPALPLPAELQKSPLPSPRVYESLRKLLDELNSRAIVMEWEHLRQTPSVWAIAAGRVKLHVLWTLLICKQHEREKSKSLIKELSVDLESAKSLIKAVADYGSAPAAIQDWYAAICPTVFSMTAR